MTLKAKMEALALQIADALLEDDITLSERIDGLKTLSGYYATVKRAESGERNTTTRWAETAAAIGSDGVGAEE